MGDVELKNLRDEVNELKIQRNELRKLGSLQEREAMRSQRDAQSLLWGRAAAYAEIRRLNGSLQAATIAANGVERWRMEVRQAQEESRVRGVAADAASAREAELLEASKKQDDEITKQQGEIKEKCDEIKKLKEELDSLKRVNSAADPKPASTQPEDAREGLQRLRNKLQRLSDESTPKAIHRRDTLAARRRDPKVIAAVPEDVLKFCEECAVVSEQLAAEMSQLKAINLAKLDNVIAMWDRIEKNSEPTAAREAGVGSASKRSAADTDISGVPSKRQRTEV